MKVQLSLTSRCTSNCRFCLKRVLFERYKFEEDVDMEYYIAKRVFDHKLDRVHICSNRGEALYYPHIQATLQYAKQTNNKIDLVTNAGNRPTWWWKELAELFDDEDCVIFAVDGIGNISHQKYRSTDFYVVLKNIETFINAGGKAIWRFIRFKHNQHQVELARSIAKEIGCVKFVVLNSHTYDDVLQKPDDEVWTLDNIRNQKAEEKDYLPCFDEMYYVNVKGIVFPCCFVANVFAHDVIRERHYETHLVKLFNEEKELLNIKNNDIDYIAKKSKFFQEVIRNSSICTDQCLKWTRNIVK